MATDATWPISGPLAQLEDRVICSGILGTGGMRSLRVEFGLMCMVGLEVKESMRLVACVCMGVVVDAVLLLSSVGRRRWEGWIFESRIGLRALLLASSRDWLRERLRIRARATDTLLVGARGGLLHLSGRPSSGGSRLKRGAILVRLPGREIDGMPQLSGVEDCVGEGAEMSDEEEDLVLVLLSFLSLSLSPFRTG